MASKTELVSLIPIRNMNRAIKFYKGMLGAKLQMRAPGAMKNFWASLQVGGVQVWFIAPMKREKRSLAYHTFMVKDIRKFVRNLQGKGVRFGRAERMDKNTKVEGPIAFDRVGASAFFNDSEGNLLMVWQSDSSMM
ncbi:MAG: VOC family protein [Thermoplasmata archaeon]|nr:VOC family protein [Thermoplasmata archaeon]